ncbi:hypothetical protein GCM10023200_31220 [Actinomycetospora chlora]|uniref:Uncharacterized protein n=1 Tax=Actinomycetospora chlora TaxID=663608 RepID=A0ABP9BC74_9PSEU
MTASQSTDVSPESATPSPQMQTATVTATPWRRMACNRPENRPPSVAPMAIEAKSQPSAVPPPGGSPNTVTAASGNTARGIPTAMATMSTRNDTSSTWLMAA